MTGQPRCCPVVDNHTERLAELIEVLTIPKLVALASLPVTDEAPS
jgi:hypothetical protein